MPQPIADVPKEKVGEVVQDFIDLDGVQELRVEQTANGRFLITPVR